jgi:hypothetical protein
MNSPLPRVLVVTDVCVSTAHGTGTLLLRDFSGYPPEKLLNAYCHELGTPAWNAARFTQKPPTLEMLPLRIYNALASRIGLRNWLYYRRRFFQQESGVALANFSPEVLYCAAYNPLGLALVDQIASQLPAGVPMIQYFLDYQIPPGLGSQRYLHRVMARAQEIWALTEEIAEKIRPYADRVQKKVRVQQGFHLRLPSRWQRRHREVNDPDFTCGICGNIWNPLMALLVKRVWRRLQERFPSLKPIRWFSHPAAVQRVQENVGEVGPEIEAKGFFSGEELFDQMLDCDLMIVPFNFRRRADEDYARYSLPSRLTELLALGLPVFAIAGESTPLSRWMTQHELGPVCNGEDEQRLADQLAFFMADRQARTSAGQRSRQFAEREFALEPFQAFLYSKLDTLRR